MAVEYTNGKFEETKGIELAIREFLNACEIGTAKALHVGTKEEIEKVKQNQDTQKQINELRSKIQELSAKNSDIVHCPTDEEIRKFGNNERCNNE